ncbi:MULTISPECIES: hypoxanthine phosphoribosyltransferase [unclassified Thermotoga]|uniref:hypoxanthine phosphoribosyltransferase n=1 Tax=unclassified Thermotoga TaxID=2631113 RepID=UPI0005407691|nr:MULTISPECIES: hypoxanthine phosphoribosyltransferase [unclassified Thermotoga]AIY88054.1 hypoxanthine phosphoribosyltransferase [Thermotoga sp. Cell2]KHC91131.1 hypoxanthine phosphoribosyltransferase [Thermotoga sp. TBGT1765]KHC92044.1 hypoxanthine phosphoribosyltransferase [Thermotoga sp. TBGT1766]KHC96661.1 hypoxanthine phosphoribosyltransferase [Thermotoga sp. Xyl54]
MIKVLIDEETLKKRIKELAGEIEDYYLGKTDTIHAVCILKGSVHFFSDLMLNIRKLNVKYSFIHVSSYQGTSSTGRIRVKSWIDESIHDEYVLLVEDIVDTGLTLQYIVRYLKKYNPRDFRIVSLIEKAVHDHGVPLDFVGFRVDDKFLVGYGLDIDEKYRNLPYIGYVE